MQGLQVIRDTTLINSVELVATFDGTSLQANAESTSATETGATVFNLANRLVSHNLLRRTISIIDGKVMFQWDEHLEARLRDIANIAVRDTMFGGKDYSRLTQCFTSHDVIEGMTREQSFVQTFLRLAKCNKNNQSTVPNTLRALYWINNIRHSDWDNLIKDYINNLYTSHKLYLYRTHSYIENHYARLFASNSLRSCMTYGREILDTNKHLVKVCEDSTLRRSPKGSDTVFQPPIASYNDLEDVSLGLLSKLSPTELKTCTEYPFIARSILRYEDNAWKFVRWYGNESATAVAVRNMKATNLQGVKVRAFIGGTDNHPTYIIPYFDGEYNVCSIDLDTKYTDKRGRAFHWATVIKANKNEHVYNDYPASEFRLHYTIDQHSWVAKKMLFKAVCPITEVSLGESNAGWNKHLKAYTIKSLVDFKGLDSLLLSKKEQLEKQVKELEASIEYLNKANSYRLTEVFMETPLQDLIVLADASHEARKVYSELAGLSSVFAENNYINRAIAGAINAYIIVKVRSLAGQQQVKNATKLLLVDIVDEAIAHWHTVYTDTNERAIMRVLALYTRAVTNVKDLFTDNTTN